MARDSELFHRQYTKAFVSRWDELINWENRRRAEDGFFERILKEAKAQKVLDIACGTGYHAVTLDLSGFDVTGADGSREMVAKARENAKINGLKDLRFVKADWRMLSQSFPGGSQFDAIICLGNAFTHLFEEAERVAALREIYSLLNPGGIAIIDQRNYDTMLDRGYTSRHEHYYLGETVEVRPTEICDGFVELEYGYADGEVHHLTVYPLRQRYLTELLERTGFSSIVRYGDFKKDYEFYDPDFIVQVATKG